jgi:hypothetical protein
MQNVIRLVSLEEVNEVKQYFHENRKMRHLVELYGLELATWQMYAKDIGEKFGFPALYWESQKEYVIDAYLDWIRDLSWYNDIQEFAIVIYDYRLFLRDEKMNLRKSTHGNYTINKEMIICTFVDTVLPWWEHEIENFVVDGKAKRFNVYLVD